MSEPYGELKKRLGELSSLLSVVNLLHWDQETMMPPRAAAARADSLSQVTRLAHEWATDPRVGELLDQCEDDANLVADSRERANLREIRRDYERARKLPAALVAEISATSSRALEAWKEARAKNEFSLFRPWMEKQIELCRQKGECFGVPEGGELFDALIEEYEPGVTAVQLEGIFGPLREALTPLIAEITGSAGNPDGSLHRVELPLKRQVSFNTALLEAIGFDASAGRLDISVHPFSAGVAPGDTRITTRYRKDQFTDAVSSTMHEAGHALYEQGVPKARRPGQPLGEPLGLAIHESQSRMWENHVGRSRAFWAWATPLAREHLGPAIESYSADQIYRTVNMVEPTLIRVESDEVTYNLHIMWRFDLERAMLQGDLPVADLPAAWNERVLADLGLAVPDDARGCLQDIHWSMGSIGYFPTYTLGNLYAAQLWEAIVSEMPDLETSIAAGEFSPLLEWLREKVHSRGREIPADELCRDLTGRPLGHEPLMRHLETKFREVYGLTVDATGSDQTS